MKTTIRLVAGLVMAVAVVVFATGAVVAGLAQVLSSFTIEEE